MLTFIKRSLYAFSNIFRRQYQPVELMKEKWIADFSSPLKSCFDIKSEISYNAYLEKDPHSPHSKDETGALFLGLKKKNCMAWLETANRPYVNQVINARFRFSCPIKDCCAAGIMFRINEQGTYYLVLISNQGLFRLDAINNNNPWPLVSWTEIPSMNRRGLSKDHEVNLCIIAVGDHLIFFVDNKWIAETYDASIRGGHLGFALISYEDDETPASPLKLPSSANNENYSCRAWLDYLSVDSRTIAVEAEYKQWHASLEISAESRLRLAESLTEIERYSAAYDQILMAWKQREEAAQSVTATYTETRTRSELLYAARMAMKIGKFADVESYIDICLTMDAKDMDALDEKAKVLIAQNKYSDLVDFLPKYINLLETEATQTETVSAIKTSSISSLYDTLGQACWKLTDYKTAAAAWDKAFDLNGSNGLYAINAANAYEMIGKNEEALRHRLNGGKCYLQQENYAEMETLIAKLLETGNDNHEVHMLAEKWASGIGDQERAESELAMVNKLKRKSKPLKGRKIPVNTSGKRLHKKHIVKTKAITTIEKKAARRENKPVHAGKKPRSKTKK
jgi:tetratricopeptide (TPR) repeat protein